MKNFCQLHGTADGTEMQRSCATARRLYFKNLEAPEDDGAWKNVRVFHAVNPREIEALRTKEIS